MWRLSAGYLKSKNVCYNPCYADDTQLNPRIIAAQLNSQPDSEMFKPGCPKNLLKRNDDDSGVILIDSLDSSKC